MQEINSPEVFHKEFFERLLEIYKKADIYEILLEKDFYFFYLLSLKIDKDYTLNIRLNYKYYSFSEKFLLSYIILFLRKEKEHNVVKVLLNVDKLSVEKDYYYFTFSKDFSDFFKIFETLLSNLSLVKYIKIYNFPSLKNTGIFQILPNFFLLDEINKKSFCFTSFLLKREDYKIKVLNAEEATNYFKTIES